LSVVQQPSSAGLVARVMGMLKSPAAEWDVIDGESATVPGLFTGYVMILAAIPAIAAILWAVLASSIHFALPFAPMLGLGFGIATAVATYVVELVAVFLLGFLADALAPSFGGEKSQIQGMKLAAYTPTAKWVASVLNIIPPLGVLAGLVGGIYSLYTFWIGAPKLMKVPADKAVGFNIVLILAWIVVYWILLMVLGMVVSMVFISSAVTAGAFAH
jgi:hypothetical protein